MTLEDFYKEFERLQKKNGFMLNTRKRIRERKTGACPVAALSNDLGYTVNNIHLFSEPGRKLGLSQETALSIACAADNDIRNIYGCPDIETIREKMLLIMSEHPQLSWWQKIKQWWSI